MLTVQKGLPEHGDSCLSPLELGKRLQQSCYQPWKQAIKQVLGTDPTGQVPGSDLALWPGWTDQDGRY